MTQMLFQVLRCTYCGRCMFFTLETIFDSDFTCACSNLIETKRPHIVGMEIHTKPLGEYK